jgi:hypothetical protein
MGHLGLVYERWIQAEIRAKLPVSLDGEQQVAHRLSFTSQNIGWETDSCEVQQKLYQRGEGAHGVGRKKTRHLALMASAIRAALYGFSNSRG